MTNELRNRKEIKSADSQPSDTSAVDTIAEPKSKVSDDEEIKNTNDDCGPEPSETAKTQTDKKNE